MRKIIKNTLKALLSLLICFVLFITAARASLFGEENAILSKILLEDIQHTLHLKDIVSFVTNELNILNERYGYEKWINKGLDQVKDYGFLEYIKTDDYILGTFQNDVGKIGMSYNQDAYNLANVDEWMDQVWGKAPQFINTETKYPGSLSEWQFQAGNNMPGLFLGSGPVRNMVNRGNAELSYKHALWNMSYNQKIQDRYIDLFADAQLSNPGEASRIMAQSNTLQNIQLGRLDNTQSSILKLMAQKQLNNMANKAVDVHDLKQGFGGVVKLMSTAPTFLK